MPPKMKVSTEFTAKDKISSVIQKATKSAISFGDRTAAAFRRVRASFKKSIRGVSLFGRRSEAAFDRASKGATSYGTIVKGILGANILRTGFSYLIQGVKGFISATQKVEDATASFTPLMGSVEKAEQLVARLNKEAASTPFQFEGIASVASQLLPTMNGQIDKTADTFRMLGDTAGGSMDKLTRITRGYSKALLKGKPDMEALSMIAEANVPIFAEMAKSMGVTTTKIFELSKQGKLTNKDLTKTFKDMTKEGGIFYKGMEISSKTLTGRMSTLRDVISNTAASLGKDFLPSLKSGVDGLISIAKATGAWLKENKTEIKAVFKVLGFLLKIILKISVMPIKFLFKLFKVFKSLFGFLKKGGKIVSDFFKLMKTGGKLIQDGLINVWEAIKDSFVASFDFIKKVFFTFVDYFLTIYGTMMKVVLAGAIKIGKVAGRDVSGLKNAVKTISETQANIRSKSFIGDIQQNFAPNEKQAAAAQNGNFKADVNFNNLPAGTNVKQKKSGAQPINMNFVGAN